MNRITIKRALLSVSDKTALVGLGQALHAMGVEILSTGGSAKRLTDNQIPVTEVSEHTGFPEIMDGRVKTLHPKIHGGLLARRGQDDAVLKQQKIEPIDLLVVNLYPFQQTIAKPNCDFDTAIENIDIGGPTMIRAAAKNHRDVCVVVDPEDYTQFIDALNNDAITLDYRFTMAKKAFVHTANYDAAISNYLGTLNQEHEPVNFPQSYTCQYHKKQDLRYGENPHQNAAFYIEARPPQGCLASAEQLQGKPLSFNNIADSDAALQCIKTVNCQDHSCVIVKHTNPCGVACRETQLIAYQRAFATDPTSSFGGIIAFNRMLEAQTAEAIIDNQFVEVIIAPSIAKDALTLLEKKPNVRVLTTGAWPDQPQDRLDYTRIEGGLLLQEQDLKVIDMDELNVVTRRAPGDRELQDLLFAWQLAKQVKSNAIVYARDMASVGIGAGQMSRVYSAHIAGMKAQDEGLIVEGSVMASDAFFPFRDGIDAAAKAGIRAIIQPGGSIRDSEVIDAADEADIAMVFTGVRHFKH